MIGTTAAIIGAAALGAGASIISGNKAASAANNAANVQAAAANRAADLQHDEYLQTREDFAPWRAAGVNALGKQSDLMGLNGREAQTNAFNEFRVDPGYRFTVNEATRDVDRSAAARGLLTSGATIKAIQDRAANLADQQYGNWFNRLGGIAGTGQTATGSTASAGSAAAANEGNALISGGNARASGYINGANAFTSAAGGVTGALNSAANNYFALNGFGRSASPSGFDANAWAYGGV